MKDLRFSRFLIAMALACFFTHSAHAFSSSPLSLNKKSTALDVIGELNRSNKFADYVKQGSTAVVTGGNSGIGATTVSTLALTGMNVVMCARDLESAQKALQNVPAWCRDRVTIQELDLADFDSIQQACKAITKKYGKIQVLCNNAGVMALPQREVTKNGLEKQVGINHVGHFMFTRLLLPNMDENGRIVNVASTAHELAKDDRDWNSEQSYSAWGTYGKSKLANVLFAKELQDKLNESGRGDISSVSLHPGVIKTNLWRNTPSFLQFATNLFADKTIEQGASTQVYCSLVDEVKPGAYYKDCSVATPSKVAQGTDIREDLWSWTETHIANQGYKLPKLVGKKEKALA